MDASATVAAWRKDARDDPEGFWGRAAEELRWSKKWERVLDWQGQGPLSGEAAPAFRWYLGGRSNLAYNCLDHHVESGRGAATASSTMPFSGTSFPFRYVTSVANSAFAPASRTRSPSAPEPNPANTTMITAPIRIAPSMSAIASAHVGM